MKLSILIPSIRPLELIQYTDSLRNTAYFPDQYEIITNHEVGPTMSQLNEECYNRSHGEWIMLGNDDLVMETYGWDINMYNFMPADGVALLWPDDKIFKHILSCFPIVSRRVLDAIKFWPQPYKRYKIDDTLFDIFPQSRKIFMKEVVMRHNHDYSIVGNMLNYAGVPDIMDSDYKLYCMQGWRRAQMAAKIRSMING